MSDGRNAPRTNSKALLGICMRRKLAVLLSLGALAAGAAQASSAALGHGARYVAMGSSYAAGPGIGQSADTPRTRCDRSADNYAHQLARRRGFVLVDVSCGGATTAHILGPWNELAPQIDAVTPETRLVTVTIGGNDMGFVAGLFAGSCASGAAHPICSAMAARAGMTGAPQEPRPDWRGLEQRMRQIAREVHRRAPAARLIFVDYLTVLPRGKLCPAVPLDRAAERRARDTAQRLARLTGTVARGEGAELVRASALSQRHDACAKAAWMTGFGPPVPYHPNLGGMTAIADRLDNLLGKNPQ